MEYQKIFELYEKLYFHEVEAREKISARLQIPLAIILSYVSVYAIFVKGNDVGDLNYFHYIFFFVVLVSLSLFVLGCIYFVKAFYGHEYEFLPSEQKTEEYRNTLIDTYEGYDDCDQLVSKYFSEYLFRYYNECSSINTRVNDARSGAIHKSNTFSILNVIPLVLAFIIFVYAGLDKNSDEKEYRVNITNPITLESNSNDQISKQSVATASSAKADTQRRRENSEQTKSTEKILEDKHVKRRLKTATTASSTNETGKR